MSHDQVSMLGFVRDACPCQSLGLWIGLLARSHTSILLKIEAPFCG